MLETGGRARARGRRGAVRVPTWSRSRTGSRSPATPVPSYRAGPRPGPRRCARCAAAARGESRLRGRLARPRRGGVGPAARRGGRLGSGPAARRGGRPAGRPRKGGRRGRSSRPGRARGGGCGAAARPVRPQRHGGSGAAVCANLGAGATPPRLLPVEPLRETKGLVLDRLPGAATSSEALGPSGPIRVTPPAPKGVAAPAAAPTHLLRHLRRRWRTGSDGTASRTGARGGGARTRMAAGLHPSPAGPGQRAYYSRHSPVSTRARSRRLGARLEWGGGRWTGRRGPGRRGGHAARRADAGHGPVGCRRGGRKAGDDRGQASDRDHGMFPVTPSRLVSAL
jgi:hypothetical protein